MTDGAGKESGALLFLALQLNDSQFPIGGYSHSYGLETCIQDGRITDKASAASYLRASIEGTLLYGDLLAVSLAWEAACGGDLPRLLRLDEQLRAQKIAREIREAGEKIGSRFVKTINSMAGELEKEFSLKTFRRYVQQAEEEQMPIHYPTAYGCLAGSCRMGKRLALSGFLSAACAAMVTNCVKTVPLGQLAGQQLLAASFSLFDDVLKRLERLDINDLGRSRPAMEIAAMRHETLYSRLYMS